MMPYKGGKNSEPLKIRGPGKICRPKGKILTKSPTGGKKGADRKVERKMCPSGGAQTNWTNAKDSDLSPGKAPSFENKKRKEGLKPSNDGKIPQSRATRHRRTRKGGRNSNPSVGVGGKKLQEKSQKKESSPKRNKRV